MQYDTNISRSFEVDCQDKQWPGENRLTYL